MDDTEKRKLYLIDGSSYIYRAYHAIRGLSNSRGLPTNAVFGFTKMLLKLLSEKNPEHIAIVFDAKGPTFRHSIYPEYKANRPPMPEDMSVQIPFIKSIIGHFNIPAMEKPLYEADDIIGTMARIYSEQGFIVVMVTGDKDFKQLITPSVFMWDTMKGTVTDYRMIKETYGFEPVRVIDVMALSGDRSDNIPGIPGIGEKTAVKLIQDFISIENLYAHIDKIKRRKLKENLERYKDNAFLSKRLVTIDQWVPLDDLSGPPKRGEPDNNALSEIFRKLEFRDLWDMVTARQENTSTYKLVLNSEDLASIAAKIKEKAIVAVDTETTGKDPMHADLVGLSLSCEEGKAWYIPFMHDYPGVPSQIEWSCARDILKPVLESEKILKVGQNIKYDAEILYRHGIKLAGIYFDTMIASYVINPGLRQHNLGNLAQHYLNYRMINYKDVVGKGKGASNFSRVELNTAMHYSCEDADITLRLMHILDKQLEEDGNKPLFHEIEMALLPVLMDMELTGIRLDTELLIQMSNQFEEQLKSIKAKIFKEAGMEFNLNSSQQLAFVLFEKLKLPVQRKTAKTNRFSTDVNVLKKLCAYPSPIPKLILRYRTLSKLKSTYLDSLVREVNPVTKRIHTSYNQTVTSTGRLSSSNPNLQNIPARTEEGRKIRKAFVAEKGCHLVSADYSQIELRIMAHYSGDQAFIDAFRQNEDIHRRTASEILSGNPENVTNEMRQIAKAINFGIIYGMGPRRLAEELNIDQKTAKDYIHAYYTKYSGVLRYKEEMINMARKKGYVSTLFNRRRYLPDINSSNKRIAAESERMAINTPIQGTAADLIKKAMIHIHQHLAKEKFKTKMLLQVHDELVFEVPDNELEIIIPIIRKKMEGVHKLIVPLKVDINVGPNWDEAH